METDYTLIAKVYAGSVAYGTNTEESDVDIRGIFIANPINIRTPFFPITNIAYTNEDTVFYELNHYMKLLTANNPNILEILWAHPDNIIQDSLEFTLLRTYKFKFLTIKSINSIHNFAYDQIRRLKNQTNSEPTIDDYDDEDSYEIAHKKWNKYQKIKSDSNKSRYTILNKYGYDTKAASHTIRLLKIAIEILTEGCYNVRRSDAEELIYIRNGGLTPKEFFAYADTLLKKINVLHTKSTLPQDMDYSFVANLIIEMQNISWSSKNGKYN
jgi:uncharacterized protein